MSINKNFGLYFDKCCLFIQLKVGVTAILVKVILGGIVRLTLSATILMVW